MQRQSRIDCRGPVVSRVSPTGRRAAPASSVSLTILEELLLFTLLYLHRLTRNGGTRTAKSLSKDKRERGTCTGSIYFSECFARASKLGENPTVEGLLMV